MYQSCLVCMAQHRRYWYQRTSPVCCVRSLLTAATLNVLLCFDVELPEMEFFCLFFTLLLPTEPFS